MATDKTIILQNSEPRSVVWRPDPPGDWVCKRQMKTLCENEVWCLRRMADSGYVPRVERHPDIEIIRTSDLGEPEMVTDPEAYLSHVPLVLAALKAAGIRHGDLTEYSVIPKDNRPYLIDFAESRLWDDPRPDKRPKGDEYWLSRTMRKQAVHNQRAPEMWEAIKGAVDFKDKMVLDVGCGGGDMLLYARAAGVSRVDGIEDDEGVFHALVQRVRTVRDRLWIDRCDLNHYLDRNATREAYDIVLCLSVLPYVDMGLTISQLAKVAKHAIIECQYEGDGPGTVKDDAEMLSILLGYWGEVGKIGKTHVEGRDKWRSIWLCQ